MAVTEISTLPGREGDPDTREIFEYTKAQLVSDHRKKSHAFMLRYEGVPNQMIAKHLEVPVTTLATYFSREWRVDYELFARQEDVTRRELVHSVLKSEAIRAARVITAALGDDNPRIRLQAAREILDRVAPAERTIVKTSVETSIKASHTKVL